MESFNLKDIWQNIRRPFTRPPYHPLQKGPNGPYIFIHINKTGGTSIDRALGLRKAHMTAKQVIDEIGAASFSKAFKFTVVRNPWSKVVSHYKFRIKDGEKSLTEHPIPFREWVLKTYGTEKDPLYFNNPIMFQPQVDWLKNHKGEIEIDEILRFENLTDEFERIRSIIGGKKKLPHVNKTRKDDYRSYYDQETRNAVAEWFAEDIAAFGYQF